MASADTHAVPKVVVSAGWARPVCRQSKGARAAAAAVAAWNYAVEGPPDMPLFDATAEASAAVAQLLGADVVLTTYDVLQQVSGGGSTVVVIFHVAFPCPGATRVISMFRSTTMSCRSCISCHSLNSLCPCSGEQQTCIDNTKPYHAAAYWFAVTQTCVLYFTARGVLCLLVLCCAVLCAGGVLFRRQL
jgi:hypothetical protein